MQMVNTSPPGSEFGPSARICRHVDDAHAVVDMPHVEMAFHVVDRHPRGVGKRLAGVFVAYIIICESCLALVFVAAPVLRSEVVVRHPDASVVGLGYVGDVVCDQAVHHRVGVYAVEFVVVEAQSVALGRYPYGLYGVVVVHRVKLVARQAGIVGRVDLERVAVKSVKAPLGGYPDRSERVLRYALHVVVRQSV